MIPQIPVNNNMGRQAHEKQQRRAAASPAASASASASASVGFGFVTDIFSIDEPYTVRLLAVAIAVFIKGVLVVERLGRSDAWQSAAGWSW